jgi:dihydroflavonol-4-reductase
MAASVGQPGEQYLLGGHSVSYLQLLQRAAAMLGVAAPQRSTPAWLLQALARILQVPGMITGKEPYITPEGAAMVTAHMQCDSSKAMQMLGYRQTSIDVLLRKTLDWLTAEQLLQSR